MMGSREPFLDSFNIFAKWTAIFAFNSLSFPKTRTRHTNLNIKFFDIMLTTVKVCIFFALVITNRKLIKSTNTATAVSITGYVVLLANSLSLVIFVTNLFMEFRYRRRIWTIICGFCEIDSMVS